jgi:hypothetical protein
MKVMLPISVLLFILCAGCRPAADKVVETDHPTTTPPSETPEAFVDPNCVVNVVAGAAIPNYFGVPNNAQRNDATNAIAQLAFADLYRNPPFSIQGPAGLVRLDVQGAIAGGGRNWQVQINGVAGHSTISTMLIAGGLAGASTADRQAFVQRSARNGLVQSLGSGNIYSVTGNCN